LGRLIKALRSRQGLFWSVGVSTLMLDQAAKALFWRPPMPGVRPLVIVPHVLQFVPHEGNVRGAMGWGPTSPIFYVTAAVVGLFLVWTFLVTTPAGKTAVRAALGLLAGGAMGNLVDRVALGRVRDFIDLHWGDAFHWHTFNVADAAICVGFVLVVVDTLFSRDARELAAEQRAQEDA